MTKTFTFAILHFIVAFTVTYLLTGSVILGGAIAIVEPAINTLVFYFHEMVWKKIEHGETSQVFNQPNDKPTQGYVCGEFG
ncbi:DUF2061 domain-containing protein [Shewanella sp.]|uniref:DUF2061 domain-containing protein n=1 Tax=Shewanella sp. TaxID=50422 RepID=UPI001ECD0EFF|nr:DUF2061 domain-containing protein [Shewanella sp.]NRB24103.1 DUF2061 domain-containing protein [Shewanella sp.]